MIPVADTIPCQHRPVITWLLIALNFSIFLLLLTASKQELYTFFYRFGLIPARFAHPEWALHVGYPPGGYYSFISSMFLHSGWMHIVLNMWMLWIFGDNIEDRLGPFRYLVFYLLCGLAAAVSQVLFNPDSPLPVIGASGALAGVMGAFFLLYPRARIIVWIPIFYLPIFVEIPAIVFLGAWVLIQLYHATSAPDPTQLYAGVAWWGHIGGFLSGALLYRFFLRPEAKKKPPPQDTIV